MTDTPSIPSPGRAAPRTAGGLGSAALADLLDVPALQALLEDFHQLTGAVAAILDLRGKVLVAVGWQDICARFHRVHPQTAQNCTESDLVLTRELRRGECAAYKCRNGLWDVATPLYLAGVHVGNVYTGQFFYDDEDIDGPAFAAQAEAMGFDREAYLAALARVPRLGRERVRTIMGFLVKLAGIVSEQALGQARAEEALEASETLFRALFETAPLGIVYQDAGGRIVSANPAAERILGLPLGQLPGRTSADPRWGILREDGSPLPDDAHPSMVALRTGRPANDVVMGVRTAEDSTRWLNVCAIPLFRPGESAPFQVYTTFQDITGRRLTERALRESRETLSHILDTIPQSVFWKDRESRYLGCNRAFAVQAGLADPAQIAGKTDFDLPWPREEAEAYRADDREVMEHNSPKPHIIEPLQAGDGRRVWIDTTKIPLRGEDGRACGVLGIYEDTTERKRMEEALRASEAWHRAILSTALDGLMVVDGQGRIVQTNEAYARMTGYSMEELAGMSITRLEAKESPDETATHLRQVLARGQHRFETRQRRKDGQVIDVAVSVQAVQGGAERLVAFLQDITERKRAEQAIRASQSRLAEAQALAHLGNWELDLETGALSWSEEIYRIFGIDPEGFGASYEAFLEAIHPEDRELVNRAFTESVTYRTPYRIVHRLVMADGTLKHVEERGQTVYDGQGKALRSVGTVQDVTEARRAEEAIRASQARLAEAQALAHLGNWEMDLETRTLSWSDEFFRLFGLDPARTEATIDVFLRTVHPEDREEVERNFYAAIAARVPYRMVHRLLLADGTLRFLDVRGHTTYEADGTPLRATGTVLDITDLMRAEASRRESEERLRVLSDNLPGGMVYQVDTGEDGSARTFTYVSAGVQQLHGVTPAQVLQDAMAIYGQIHEEDRAALAEKETAAVTAMVPFSGEFRIQHPSGEVRWLLASSSPRRMPDNHLVWDGVEIDITERKRAEEQQRTLSAQLQQSQKMESLGSLAGGVAHDLNNVLAAILSLSSSFRERFSPPDPMAKALDTISSACTRGRDVVRNLLVFARRDLEKEAFVDLNALVADTAHLLAHTTLKRASLVTDLQEGLPGLRGDASALSHALINLCVNATDAMPGGGTITLATRRGAEGGLILSVRDTGAGMSPDVLKRAVEPFFTTKPQGKGTGLGLSMVYGTMQAHDGTVTLRSRPGAGTEVELAFPASRLMASAAEAPAPAGIPEASQNLRVLLVDDDELIRDSVGSMLELLGFDCAKAPGGREALGMLEAGLDADLVVLDMNMPGMSGAEALPRILALRPRQKVLIASGYLDDQAKSLQGSHPTVRLIEKPFTLAELKKAIARFSFPAPR